jgi:hypothetical protein
LAAAPLTRIKSGCCPVAICLLEYDKILFVPITSVVGRHRFDADPDPNFRYGTNPDPDPDWHQNNAVTPKVKF